MIDPMFWRGKKVFVTGHTGFKGSWLCLWLCSLGAKVTGYSLAPPTNPSLFELCNISKYINSVIGDIRDRLKLQTTLFNADPDIVIHMAAQPLVRESYRDPIKTYEINVLGTAYLLEAIRILNEKKGRVKAVVNVTSDKCYENQEWPWGYRENERLGGYDPYSNSKACSELITSCYLNSFFNAGTYHEHGVGVATVRAGNVIGGGDWALERLIPDCLDALQKGNKIKLRNPHAIRPWQHVLEPLSGYLLLAQQLYSNGKKYAGAWNFGPDDNDCKSVEWITKNLCNKWGNNASYEFVQGVHPHEAHYLKLDCSKAKAELGWYPRWGIDQAIDRILEWIKEYKSNNDVREISLKQIEEYQKTKSKGIS